METDGTTEQSEIQKRREARRRKILENAKSRMDAINSNISKEKASKPPIEEKVEEYSDPEIEHANIERNGIPPSLPPSIFSSQHENPFENMNTIPENNEPEHILLRYKIHIILLAILSFILSTLNYEITQMSVFLPIGIFLIIELIFFRKEYRANTLTTFLIAFSRINLKKVNQFLTFFSIFQKTIIDIGVFVFILCLLNFITNKFLLEIDE